MQDEESDIVDSATERVPPGRRSRLGDPTPALPGQVRRLRQRRGWTLDELATASDVSKSMLSQIERGEANPTLAVAFRIARAFGVSLDDLVAAQPTERTIQVVRADDPTYHYRDDPDCRIRTLSPLHLQKDAEFYELSLAPGRALASAPHAIGTRELLAVAKGQVRLLAGTDAQTLQTGDSAYYPADVQHTIENIGRDPAILFLVDMYRR